MQDLTLVTSPEFGFKEIEQDIKKISNCVFVRPNEKIKVISDDNTLTIEFKIPDELFGTHIIIDKISDEEMGQTYEPAIMEKFKKTFSQPQFFMIRFHNIEYVKILLRSLTDINNIYIDNNNMLVLPGNEFLKKLERNPNWDGL